MEGDVDGHRYVAQAHEAARRTAKMVEAARSARVRPGDRWWGRHWRWSDGDRRYGPMILARDRDRRHLALVLSSGKRPEDADEASPPHLRATALGVTVLLRTPAWLARPSVERREFSHLSPDQLEVYRRRTGRTWYYEYHRRDYGISVRAGYAQLRYGRQDYTSETTRSRGWFLPWTAWRHVRRSWHGLDGAGWRELRDASRPRRSADPDGFDAWRDLQNRFDEECPSRTFLFQDYDGEQLTVRTQVGEREWRLGEGWFRWLSLLARARVVRSLDLRFSGEVGRRKGSWKGGTVGHSIEMRKGELHEAAFRRYCAENDMTFGGEVEGDDDARRADG